MWLTVHGHGTFETWGVEMRCGTATDNSLHWLVDVLQAAEDAGERVLMLRHIPNASR